MIKTLQVICYTSTRILSDFEAFSKQLKGYAANDKTKDRIDINENVSMYIFENGKITNVIINAERLSTKQIDVFCKKIWND
ncbi:MAG: hypothetical protein V8R01_07520 [Bacilli bacterium]